jgi:hypothetical protein
MELSVELSNRIEKKRKEMIITAGIYGFSDSLTIKASQELDSLLNALTLRYCKKIKSS